VESTPEPDRSGARQKVWRQNVPSALESWV
jgi:hypothetical protein